MGQSPRGNMQNTKILKTLLFSMLLEFFYYFFSKPSIAPKRLNSVAAQSVKIRLCARASNIDVCSIDCKEKQKLQDDEKQIGSIGV